MRCVSRFGWPPINGTSTGDLPEALQSLFGAEAQRLLANTVTRLKAAWQEEHWAWSKRSLQGKYYVCGRADSVHFNIRFEEGRQCILVMMGKTADGYLESPVPEGTAARLQVP
jgi:putative transposase